jgi:hypothetical protein
VARGVGCYVEGRDVGGGIERDGGGFRGAGADGRGCLGRS